MTSYGTTPDEVLATVEAQAEAAVERMHRASAFRESLDSVRGHGRCGATTAVVDASGLLVSVDFAGEARAGGTAAKTELMAAVYAAQRDVHDQVTTRARETWGVGDPMVDRLDAELSARFSGAGLVPESPTGGRAQ